MKEIWKNVLGYEGIYKVSSFGNVKSLDRYIRGVSNSKLWIKGKMIKSWIDNKGYCIIDLSKYGVRKHNKLSRIVMQSFNGYSNLEVNHIDYNPKNNHLDNLEYCTRQKNVNHSVHNIKKANSGEGNRHAKLKNKDIYFIRKNYKSFSDMKIILEKYPITDNTVFRIIRRKTWAHI